MHAPLGVIPLALGSVAMALNSAAKALMAFGICAAVVLALAVPAPLHAQAPDAATPKPKAAPAKPSATKPTAKPGAAKAAPAKPSTAKGAKKAPPGKAKAGSKKAPAGKAAGKAGTKGKAVAGKPKIAKLPDSAKAPLLPRREPITLTAKDRESFTEAMKAVESRAWPRAIAAAGRTNNPILKKVVNWAYLREPGEHVTFSERSAFIANNPGWPGLKDIQRRAEDALGDPITVTVPTVLASWFAENPPLTANGRIAYASSLRSVGKAEEATAMAREAWRTANFDRSDERPFLDAFGSDIRPEDNRARLERMLYDENTAAAERMIPRVDLGFAAVARARIALMTDAGNVDSLLRAVPQAFADDPGLVYDRVKWRRKRDQTDAARALLPQNPDRGPRPDLMWKERQILARDALNNGLISEAYTIVKNHGEIDGNGGLADAEWLAGWIALRFLKDREAALVHFEKVYDTVQLPANVARGAYWTGRTAESLGRADIAADWYRRAATYVTTYYGQLALAHLHDDPLPALSDDPTPNAAERADFEARELTQATRALADVHNTTYLRAFVMALADSSDDAGDRHMTAEFADRLGHPDWSVSVGRQAGRANITLLQYGYPVPAYTVPNEPERAFILAISRQESNFDPNAQSVAGAMGLMQLMPATAKGIAKKIGVKYEQRKLTAEPAYNLRLGAEFLGSLVNNFDGSYILAAAAYNAGPSRARQWMRQYGDPRDGQTDPVDWVEQIPFSETRTYVQRVMENVMVYRARLAKTRTIGQSLEADLARPFKKQASATPG